MNDQQNTAPSAEEFASAILAILEAQASYLDSETEHEKEKAAWLNRAGRYLAEYASNAYREA